MIELLLELKNKYPNDQEFGKVVRKILSDNDFLELEDVKITDIIPVSDNLKDGYYNKYNFLVQKLKDKEENE